MKQYIEKGLGRGRKPGRIPDQFGDLTSGSPIIGREVIIERAYVVPRNWGELWRSMMRGSPRSGSQARGTA